MPMSLRFDVNEPAFVNQRACVLSRGTKMLEKTISKYYFLLL